MAEPVRCEFFDDEVDSLGSFDVISQRRTKNLESGLVFWSRASAVATSTWSPPPLSS